MDKRYGSIEIDVDKDGYANNAKIAINLPEDFTKEAYEEYVDQEAISYDMLMSLVTKGEKTGEYVPIDVFKDEIKEYIKDAILNNEYEAGDFEARDGLYNASWEFEVEATLDGEEVAFCYLDDVTKEVVINNILGGVHNCEIFSQEYYECNFEVDGNGEGVLRYEVNGVENETDFYISENDICYCDELVPELSASWDLEEAIREEYEMCNDKEVER